MIPIKTQAYKIIFLQLIIIVGLAVVLFLLRGIQTGISSLLGSLAYWVPSLALVWRIFSPKNLAEPKRFVMALFIGEWVKLFISAFLFLVIVKYVSVSVLSVLIGYAAAIMAFWVAALVLLSRNQGVSL